MSHDEPTPDHDPPTDADADVPDPEELTSPSGTPVPVDITRDLQARTQWVVLLAGPVIWLGHFSVVYLVAEAGCNGAGPGLERLDAPVPSIVTLVATIVAVLACVVAAYGAWNRIPRGPGGVAATDPAAHERHRVLSVIGGLISLLALAGVLFVAAPALWLPC